MQIPSDSGSHVPAQLLDRVSVIAIVKILYPATQPLVESGHDRRRPAATILPAGGLLFVDVTDAGQRLR